MPSRAAIAATIPRPGRATSLVDDAGERFERRAEALAPRQAGRRAAPPRPCPGWPPSASVSTPASLLPPAGCCAGASAWPCACPSLQRPPGNRPVRTARPITSRIRARFAGVTTGPRPPTRRRAASPSAPGTTPSAGAGKSRDAVHPGEVEGQLADPAVGRGGSRRRGRPTRPARPNSRGLVPSQPSTLHAERHPLRRLAGLDALGAQAQQHPRDVDADRADFLARAAQAARRAAVRGTRRMPASSGGEHRADRPGVDAAVGVAADLLVDGAGVEAGAAADAVAGSRPARWRAPGCGRCRR